MAVADPRIGESRDESCGTGGRVESGSAVGVQPTKTRRRGEAPSLLAGVPRQEGKCITKSATCTQHYWRTPTTPTSAKRRPTARMPAPDTPRTPPQISRRRLGQTHSITSRTTHTGLISPETFSGRKKSLQGPTLSHPRKHHQFQETDSG